jgi:hypothetical protein
VSKEVKVMKGTILKIKTGYNPNSSSIGVDVVAFFTAGAAMMVLFNVVASVLQSASADERRRPEELEPAPVAAGEREKA